MLKQILSYSNLPPEPKPPRRQPSHTTIVGGTFLLILGLLFAFVVWEATGLWCSLFLTVPVGFSLLYGWVHRTPP